MTICDRRLGLKAARRLHCAHVRRYRGRRSGRPRLSSPVLRDAGNGVAVIVGNRPAPRVFVPRQCMFVVQYMSIYTQRLQVEHRCSIVTTSTQSLTSWMIRWKYAMSCRSTRCFSLKHGMTAIYSVSSVSVWTGSRSSIARDHGPAPPLWLQNMAAWLRWQSLEFVCVRSTSVSKQPRSSCFAPVFSGSSDCDVTVVYCTGSIL